MTGSQHRRQEAPAAAMTPAEAAQKHNRVLLHALHTAHPMLYQGKQRFIHTLTFSILGGGTSATVYLTGDSAAVEPNEVQLQARPT